MKRTEIVNADKPLEIEVPAQLTKSSRRKTAYACVFAKACQKIPNVEEAIIHLSTAYLKFKNEKHFRRYRVGQRLRDQIVMFDKYGDFEPGIYALAALQPSHRARGTRQGTPGTGKYSSGLPRRGGIHMKGVRHRANIATL
jgi:hypothetical protein